MSEDLLAPLAPDGEGSTKDYDFTRKARKSLRGIYQSDYFEEMDSEDIHRVMLENLNRVTFGSQLKRYIYKRTGRVGKFSDLDDSVYMEAISGSFEMNGAPHSFEPTSTRWNTTIRSWLKSERVRRETVFLLGFGLRMTAADVSTFLMKYLNEDDFREDDVTEVIYKYCLSRELPYHQVLKWKSVYQELSAESAEKLSAGMNESERRFLSELLALKTAVPGQSRSEKTAQVFRELYDQCRKMILGIFLEDRRKNPDREKDKNNYRDLSSYECINAGDLEQMLCSGIPQTDSGNLIKADAALLNRHFQSYRPSRQRIGAILSGKLVPDRYDLITLLFFLYSDIDKEPSDEDFLSGSQRLQEFLPEANRMLQECGLGDIYITNPYEAFIILCVLSESPLSMYNDIWEESYTNA